MMCAQKQKRTVLIVTGLAGAGLSTALKALEDMHFMVIDNLPLTMMDLLLSQEMAAGKSIAIGIDSRTWGFTSDQFLKEIAILKTRDDVRVELLFMTCAENVLQQRFIETRRVHPLASDRPVKDGIAQDRQMMAGIKESADHIIDTTDMKAQELRQILLGYFFTEHVLGKKTLFVSVMSFGFKHGLPREADMVLDVRFLDNPYWHDHLRDLSGLDVAIQDHIQKDAGYQDFFNHMTGMLEPLLPRYVQEGKHYFTIAIGCTGGRHRSVFTAFQLHAWLETLEYRSVLRHRDIDKAKKHARAILSTDEDKQKVEKTA